MAQNDILLFAQGANPNIMPQAAWSTAPSRTSGFQSGVADSATANKLWRQTNWMSYLLAQWVVDQSGQNMLDDGNYANAKAALVAAINQLIANALAVGGFATIAALNAESNSRSAVDGAEATARSSADTNEAQARYNADQAIYSEMSGKYCARLNKVGYARRNFYPAPYTTYINSLSFDSGFQGGLVTIIGSANNSGFQPSGSSHNIKLNGVVLNGDTATGSMTNMAASYIYPNTSNYVEQVFVAGGDGSPGFQFVGLNLTYSYLAG